MIGIFDRPRMATARAIANLLVAAVLIAVLVGLVWIAIDERCGKNESAASPKRYVQEVPFR